MLHADTKERILVSAQALAQQRGFNAFSYADIAASVGVRKASIHHYFPHKEDLELELVQRYRHHFLGQLERIDQEYTSAADRLRQYGGLYQTTQTSGNICLCGMMASDVMALPEVVRMPLHGFFAEQSEWLLGVLDVGRKNGELVFRGPAVQKAHAFLACLQGGLLIAHATRDPALLSTLLDDFLTGMAS